MFFPALASLTLRYPKGIEFGLNNARSATLDRSIVNGFILATSSCTFTIVWGFVEVIPYSTQILEEMDFYLSIQFFHHPGNPIHGLPLLVVRVLSNVLIAPSATSWWQCFRLLGYFVSKYFREIAKSQKKIKINKKTIVMKYYFFYKIWKVESRNVFNQCELFGGFVKRNILLLPMLASRRNFRRILTAWASMPQMVHFKAN